MARWLALFVVLSGCQLVFDLEAGDVGGRCAAGTPFGPGRDAMLDSALGVESVRFDASLRRAFLSMCPGAKSTCDIQSAEVSKSGVLDNFAPLGNVNSDTYDSYPTLSADEQYLLFGSERAGSVRIFQAASVGGSFERSVVTELELVAGADATNEPYLAPDAVYYSALDFDGSTKGSDLYRSPGAPPAIGPGEPVPGANSADNEFAPVVSEDELELFFASNRLEPGGGAMALDIYTTTRAAPGAAFAEPTRVDAISTSASIDWPLWISPDGCDLYYIFKQNDLATLRVTSRR